MTDARQKTYWLSFCATDRPQGEQFLGVVIVDITDTEAAAAKQEIDERFPRHADGAEWIAAAIHKTYALGCNPGGEVAYLRIDPIPADAPPCPRNRLLSRDDLLGLGHLHD